MAEELPSDSHEKEEQQPEVVGVYRLVSRAMLIEGLPEQFIIGGAVIRQEVHPLMTQRTTLVQEPGLALAWRKRMDRDVEVGAGVAKTICAIPIGLDENLMQSMQRAREQAICILGYLSAVLDERIAIEEMFEDVVVLDEQQNFLAMVDVVRQVREYMPRVFHETEEAAVASLAAAPTRGLPVCMAARWYLAAAQQGPRADGVVSFWVAIEALVPDARGKKVVRHVEDALRENDFNPETLPMSVGRLYNLRADIVHKGNDEPDDLRKGYYALETVVRELIRVHLNAASDWPSEVAANTWPEPLRGIVESLRGGHRTYWENPLGD